MVLKNGKLVGVDAHYVPACMFCGEILEFRRNGQVYVAFFPEDFTVVCPD